MKDEIYRITTMNQYGDILYTGKYKKGVYRTIGDYPENLSEEAIEEILNTLYHYEEGFEDFLIEVNK